MAGMDAEAITESLELVGERCADPTAQVYARLFARHPEMEALFVRDTDLSVRGNMLQQVIEAILDIGGRGAFGRNLVRAEVVNHENLGVPRDVFPAFFDAVRETFRGIAGEAWTPAMEAAWGELVAELEATAAQ
jgi:hemoglobin-like flavoprotein